MVQKNHRQVLAFFQQESSTRTCQGLILAAGLSLYAAAAAAAAAVGADSRKESLQHLSNAHIEWCRQGIWSNIRQKTLCEASNHIPIVPRTVTWWNTALYRLGIQSLPLPRVVKPHDPDLQVPRRALQQRQHDALRVQEWQVRLATLQKEQQKTSASVNSLQTALAQHVQELYTILYGPSVTPADRNAFLQQYGCTGWTEPVLQLIVSLGMSQGGIVEMGAGHGQWAQAISDYYYKHYCQDNNNNQRKVHDFVVAYDDYSELPNWSPDPTLPKQQQYKTRSNPKSPPLVKVQPCPSLSVLTQWTCRGRVLLLVYPPSDSDMAVEALQQYTEASTSHTTLIYVGEGRGGANANDAFFDALQGWMLVHILPVQSFGNKGYEQCFVFQVCT
jgi:hypothetical protein